MTEAQRARLSGPAARFVYLLRDFGHLDEGGVARLLLAASEEVESHGEALIDLPAMRKVAARLLFDQSIDQLSERRGILAEDWPLLFS